jgi:hypothetical protein
MEQVIRAWHIGEYNEIYAGRCDEEGIKLFLHELCGKDAAVDSIESLFEEIPQDALDVEIDWRDSGGDTIRTTLRREAESYKTLPAQIGTTYN